MTTTWPPTTEGLIADVRNPERDRAEVSLLYAVAIVSTRADAATIRWAAVNGAIIERWSVSVLRDVKDRAWRLVEGR